MPGRLLLLSQAPSFSLTSPLCSLDCFSRLLCLHMLFLHVFTLSLVHFTTLSTWWTPLIFKVELKPHSFYEASSALLIFLVSIAPSAYLHCFLTPNDVVQFSCSVVSNSLRPHGLQHARPPCPSPNPRVYSNSCPSSQWCHPTVSSSLVCFSSRLQPFPASVSFQMSLALCIRWPKYWSFSFSISPSSEYSGLISFRMYWFDLLLSTGLFKSLLQHHSSKASILWHSSFFI